MFCYFLDFSSFLVFLFAECFSIFDKVFVERLKKYSPKKMTGSVMDREHAFATPPSFTNIFYETILKRRSFKNWWSTLNCCD